jgi:hypothetical protein
VSGMERHIQEGKEGENGLVKLIVIAMILFK